MKIFLKIYWKIILFYITCLYSELKIIVQKIELQMAIIIAFRRD